MKRIDLTGERFGRLVVVKYLGDRKWLCKCDCGNETSVLTSNLRNRSKSPTRSCGCLSAEMARYRNILPEGECNFNGIYGEYRRRAKRKGIEFSLNKDEFRQLTKWNCFYCGAPPTNKSLTTRRQNGYYEHNGIDRRDSGLGYTIDNCVGCCKTCNMMKNSMTVEEFLKHIERIYHFNEEVSDSGE